MELTNIKYTLSDSLYSSLSLYPYSLPINKFIFSTLLVNNTFMENLLYNSITI